MTQQVAVSISLWIIAGVLAASGLSKLWRPIAAAESMVSFGLIRHASKFAGAFAGIVEAVVAGLAVGALAGAIPIRVVGVLSATLFALFSYLLARSLKRGETFKCNCFTTSGDEISSSGLARAIALLLISVPLVFVTKPPAEPVQALLGAAVAIGLWLIATLIYEMRNTNRDPFGNARELWESRSYEVKETK